MVGYRYHVSICSEEKEKKIERDGFWYHGICGALLAKGLGIQMVVRFNINSCSFRSCASPAGGHLGQKVFLLAW